MYPRLSDIFKDLFGFSFPIPIYSFGAMLAVAFLLAAWVSRRQLDRMYEAGRIGSVRVPAPQEKGKKGKAKRGATREASPSVLVGTLTVIAVVAGLAGAKLFHILENLGAFAQDPLGMIFSTGGLTFFGGLIVATLALAWYLRKKGLSALAVADAVAPGLMLAYGVGRIGCHLAGDGDWGIAADLGARPDWLPTWLWAESYPNAIIGAPDVPVYPTSLYEFGMCLALFGVMWAVRKHPFLNGWMFSLYLVFAGIERFLIEQIRVNNKFDLFGMQVTQAEVISVILVLVGAVGLALTWRRFVPEAPRRRPAPAASQAA